MKTLILITAICSIGLTSAFAADKQPGNKKEAANLKANPNDLSAYNSYMRATVTRIRALMKTNPDKSEKLIDQMEAFLKTIEPTEPPAKTLHQRALNASNNYRQMLELERTPIQEYIKQLKTNPDDVKALTGYYRKASSAVSGAARTQPDVAEKKLNEMRTLLTGLEEKSKDAAAGRMIERYINSLASHVRRIESGKKMLSLIGKDAAELNVDAWVNGKPLTQKDLKGKVVLLDFWAVWCGPCIATFPHLREWQEKYSGKGLVIIGLTRQYNYTWNDETNRVSKSKEENTPAQEQAMLGQFAAHHKLKHRFAIQKDRTISDYYGVTGIPHVVLIDQKGEIRIMRVGSGEKNAHDVEAIIKKLLSPKVAAAGK